LLVLVAVLPSLHSLGAYFVGDDFDFLVRIRRMSGIGQAWTLSFWGEWEPLWYLGFYRDWKMWGLAPAGYHAASLFWLALGVVALFRLTRELWPGARLAPWAAALLFATHPLHDEAVTYLAARGHPMSTALMLVALACYARGRRAGDGGRRWPWVLSALPAALLAALAKETALILPGLVFTLELFVFGAFRARLSVMVRAVGGALLFAIPAAAYLALRHAAVGLGSQRLRGPDEGAWEVLEKVARFVPEYAVAGGMPLPFAFAGEDLIRFLRPMGWIVIALILLPALALALRSWLRTGEVPRSTGIYLWALAFVLVCLLPVFWADLGLKRRYFFAPSAGAAVAAAIVLQWLAMRRVRLAWAMVLALAFLGGLGLAQRNLLYLGAGRVTRDLVEAARGEGESAHRVVLVTLPRYYGGDDFSGAYVMHRTDAWSALRLAGGKTPRFSSGIDCHHAEDYAVEVTLMGEGVLDLTVRFRTHRAYAAARRRSPREDRAGSDVTLVPLAFDDRARTLQYRAVLSGEFLRDERNVVYLYSEGSFRRAAVNLPQLGPRPETIGGPGR
jgi:hypothetical protein